MNQPEVLFVCGRNAVRSPMAEALFNQKAGGGAISCGVAPAGFPDGHMLTVMKDIGLDLTDFECQGLESVSDHPKRLVCLTEDIAETATMLAAGWSAPMEVWNIPDPSMESGPRDVRLMAYTQVRDAIDARVDTLIASLNSDKIADVAR